MYDGSVVEVYVNRSEVQICATDLSFFVKWLTPSICRIPPPSPQRSSNLSLRGRRGREVACGLKTAKLSDSPPTEGWGCVPSLNLGWLVLALTNGAWK